MGVKEKWNEASEVQKSLKVKTFKTPRVLKSRLLRPESLKVKTFKTLLFWLVEIES